MHPNAEFVIPQAHQQRQLAAYRLSDFGPEELKKWKPDFILEYFEGADYVQPERRGEDRAWVRFWRQVHQSTDLPPYVVALRPAAERAP
jgi:hypothetical protein